MARSLTRRLFLVGSALVGGALVIGGSLAWRRLDGAGRYRPATAAGETALTPWFKLTPENRLVVLVPRQDMGQGIVSMLAQIVAEELDFDWARVTAEQAGIHPVYANTVVLADGSPPALRSMMENVAKLIGVQMTGGSTSVRDAWGAMRHAAAAARVVLLEAAATRWQLPAGELGIELGVVRHAASGRSAPLAEFASDAAVRALPASPAPKAPAAWRLLGTSPPRLDVAEKTLGSARYGIDARPEGLLYAAVRHIPLVRGELQAVRWPGGKPPPVVLHEVRGSHWLAVIARSWREAERALDQAELVARGETATTVSTARLAVQYRAVLDGEDDPRKLPDLGRPIRRVFNAYGDPDRALAAAPEKARLSADYAVPFLAHAPMEPLNCTARIRDGKVDVWVGNQAPTIVQWLAAGVCDVPTEAVNVHTPWLGGGFGRRFDLEVIRQALACAKVAGGRPVQLIWSRPNRD
ncbi:MAG: molybdopterin cofactor-binding domain-containing protein [Casimicrobiaceae bacterium]